MRARRAKDPTRISTLGKVLQEKTLRSALDTPKVSRTRDALDDPLYDPMVHLVITGGYGFLGVQAARRFLRAGVCWSRLAGAPMPIQKLTLFDRIPLPGRYARRARRAHRTCLAHRTGRAHRTCCQHALAFWAARCTLQPAAPAARLVRRLLLPARQTTTCRRS